MKTVSPVATGSSESLSAQSLSSQVDLARKQPAEPSTPLAPPEEASASASPVHQSTDCPRKPKFAHSNKKQYKVKDKTDTTLPKETIPRVSNSFSKLEVVTDTALGTKALEKRSTSNTEIQITSPKKASHEQSDVSSHFAEVEHDSSDISSSEDTSDPELQRTLAEFTEVYINDVATFRSEMRSYARH
ncbi:hypothetical protein YC2023_040628 [Brassica napus]